MWYYISKQYQGSNDAGKVPFSRCSSNLEIWTNVNERHRDPNNEGLPIHLGKSMVVNEIVQYDKRARRTGAQRVICLPKLFARGIILALGRNALEVVSIVLEAAIIDERWRGYGTRVIYTNSWSGSCWGNELESR
jgi:hypothetical protein